MPTIPERGELCALFGKATEKLQATRGDKLKPWRSISGKLLSNKRFKLQLESEGWHYVSVKGKKGSYLERTTTDKSLVTQLDPEHETAPLSVAMRALAA
jgi:hypothetical protein